MVVVNTQTKHVSFLSKTLPGFVNNKKVADHAKFRYPRSVTLRSDRGLQGYAPEVRDHLQPKKPKNRELKFGEKRYNSKPTRVRLRAEHAIAMFKICRFKRDVIRNLADGLSD